MFAFSFHTGRAFAANGEAQAPAAEEGAERLQGTHASPFEGQYS